MTAGQGRKFLQRFDPVTYVHLTRQMDTHDLGRGRPGGVRGVLSRVRARLLVMGISSDHLYPLAEQREIAAAVPGARLAVIESDAGHDGFLLEQDQVSAGIASLLAELPPP